LRHEKPRGAINGVARARLPMPSNKCRGVPMGSRFGRSVRRLAMALLVAGMGVVGNASATLLDRGPDMVYDDVLNITWVRDASLCATLNNCLNRADTFVTGGMAW